MGIAGEPSTTAARAKEATYEEGEEELLEKVLERGNLLKALKRVEENRGAAGVDGMKVAELRPYLKAKWLAIREGLLEGTYEPSPVRRVEIPKPEGGTRQLGIPTVLDRFIQQALLQVLTVKDKRVLRLIRKYLKSGVMLNGVIVETGEGTPQGGPLSPLLSNIYLNELDKELEKRGHKFCRYADDCNVYVQSKRAGERVMASVRCFLKGRLKLKVNEAKSALDRPCKRTFLGFSYMAGKEAKIRLATRSLKRVKEKLRELTRRNRSQEMKERIRAINGYLGGWVGYFALAETPSILAALDGWLRHRLRACLWKQWKRVRTRRHKLRALKLPERVVGFTANTRKGPWRMAASPPLEQGLNKAYWAEQGLASLLERYNLTRNTW